MVLKIIVYMTIAIYMTKSASVCSILYLENFLALPLMGPQSILLPILRDF